MKDKTPLTKGFISPPGEWMQLNPDFRRDAPRAGRYCCRCQRPLQNITGWKSIEVNWDKLECRNNILNPNELIGLDCWEQVLKEHKNE